MSNKNLTIIENKEIFYLKNNNNLNKKGVIIFVHGFTSSYYLHHEFVLNSNFSEYDYFSMNFHEQDVNSKDDLLEKYDIDYFVNKLIAKIEEYEFKNIILIGHSMGGGICLLTYMKIASKIKKIILVDAINPAIYTSTIGIKYLVNVFKDKKNKIKLLEIDKNIKGNIETKFIIDEYLNYELDRFLIKKSKFIFLGIKLLLPSLYRKLNKVYKTITVPTLYLAGEHDKIIPAKKTEKYIKNLKNKYIKFEIIKNASHIPFVESFDEYKKEVWKFIK